MDKPNNFKKKEHSIIKKKGNFKSYKNQDFRKNYGSLQEGHGLALLQKNKVKRFYISEQKKENKKNWQENTEFAESSVDVNADDDPYAKYHEDREVFDALPSKAPKLSKFQKAKQEYENKQEEKERKKIEREAKLKEIEEKRRQFKEKRLARNKKFSRKTSKGQPLMKARMELLLEDVETLLQKEKINK